MIKLMSEQTCVVSRVIVGIQKLLDSQGTGKQRMLGNGVQIVLQSSLPLCYELPVHISNQLLRRKRETDAAPLEPEKGTFIFLFYTLPFICCMKINITMSRFHRSVAC